MISPQGYKLGEEPKNKNPFWGEGEDSNVNRIYATATVDEGTGVPSVSTSKTVSGNDITFGFDFHNLKGKDGVGKKGDPGFSPSARVEQTETGATITITDKSGTTTATVKNGEHGKSGFSPSARVEQTETGATITVTDKSGTTTATVKNGTKGNPGVTPSIAVTASVDNTTGTPSVNVTKTGTNEAPAFNFAFTGIKGSDGHSIEGPAGPGVPAGGTAGQVLVKKSGIDYDTEWKDPTGGGAGQQIVKWGEDDYGNVYDVYPIHSYSGYGIHAQSITGSSLEPVKGTMDSTEYTITFSDNVTLSIPEKIQYQSDSVSLVSGLSFNIEHNTPIRANLRIPTPANDIIITGGSTPVKAKGRAYLDCNIEDGSVVYIEGTINTDAGSFIKINKTQLLSISSDYVDKCEVLKTVQG